MLQRLRAYLEVRPRIKRWAFRLFIVGLFFTPGDRLVESILSTAAQQNCGLFGCPITSPLGTEIIPAYPIMANGQPAAVTASVTLNQVRNATGHALVATGTTVNSTPTNIVDNLIATGAITTWNVTLPNPAYDGELFAVVNGTGSSFTTNTSVTVGSTPQAQVLPQTYSGQTLAANGGSAEWTFDLATLTWYRVR